MSQDQLSLESQSRNNFSSLELSIVMPCLNEAETLATCIQKAQSYLQQQEIVGEIIIADNGSTDGSREIASSCGARVVPVPARGYGSALRGGISAARGQYIIMGDADDSYDFTNLNPFVEKLRSPQVGNDFYRRPRGDGKVVCAAVFVFRERPNGVVFLRAAQSSRRQPIHRPLDIDHIIVAAAHPRDASAASAEFFQPILRHLGTHLDDDIERLEGCGKIDHLHADLVEHHRGMHLLGAATVDKNSLFHLRREVEELDKENAVLENPIFPDGLVAIADMDGHADAKFAIGFRHRD